MADDVDKKQRGEAKSPHGSGKFAKGNTSGSLTQGKQPSHTKKIEFAEIFKAAVSNQDIKDIAAAMVQEAKAGNVKAASMILDRCCGKPAQAMEITGAEGGPIVVQIIQFGGADDSKPTIPG